MLAVFSHPGSPLREKNGEIERKKEREREILWFFFDSLLRESWGEKRECQRFFLAVKKKSRESEKKKESQD